MPQTKTGAILPESPVENVPLTATQSSTDLPGSENKTKSAPAQTHPRGHKVYQLDKVWETMDQQSFLHLTDTLTLGDVWVQPVSVTPMNAAYANVAFKEIVLAPHIKQRTAETKMSADDLIKMLYLSECLQWYMQGVEALPFDDWLNDKSAACVKVKGMEVGSNRALLCNFIITEDREFTFYPPLLKGNFGIFFRKICYHSYKTTGEGEKLSYPGMIKCCATRGKFEYILEARIIPLPVGWFDVDVTPTQPMEGGPLA